MCEKITLTLLLEGYGLIVEATAYFIHISSVLSPQSKDSRSEATDGGRANQVPRQVSSGTVGVLEVDPARRHLARLRTSRYRQAGERGETSGREAKLKWLEREMRFLQDMLAEKHGDQGKPWEYWHQPFEPAGSGSGRESGGLLEASSQTRQAPDGISSWTAP